jgi:predicted DNA binding protein
MSIIAEFTMRSSRLALQPTLQAMPDVTVELEGQIATSHHHPLLVVWATGGDVTAFESGLDGDPTVERATVVERLEETRLYRIELTDDLQAVYPTYQELGAAPLAGTGTHEGWYRRVRFPDRDALARFRDFCTDRDITFSLHRLYRPSAIESDDDLGLTDEQRRALQAAFQAGYFEVPRGTGLAELGDHLGVSAQSVSERLRRGVGRVLATTVCREKRGESIKDPELSGKR